VLSLSAHFTTRQNSVRVLSFWRDQVRLSLLVDLSLCPFTFLLFLNALVVSYTFQSLKWRLVMFVELVKKEFYITPTVVSYLPLSPSLQAFYYILIYSPIQ